MGKRLTDTFLLLFCEKNSDDTKKLRLKGNELYGRIGTRLESSDVGRIVRFLDLHPEINDINLCYNSLEDRGLQILADTILSGPNFLEHLNLMNCGLTEEGMYHLTYASQMNHLHLKSLRISGNKLGPQGGYFMSSFIQNQPNLEYLDIANTSQTVDSLDCIFNQVYRSEIKVLDISRVIPNHFLYQVDSTSLVESVSCLFHVNNTLIEIHMQNCNLDGHNMETMIHGLKVNSSLKFLDIGYNKISCTGLEFLSEWLKTRPNLLGLNVAGNSVKDDGAIALSFAMPSSKLRYLDISDNKIGNEGIIAILHSVKKPYMLRYFFFWGNSFSHPANKIIRRLIRSTVLQQEYIDVKIYCVDGVLHAARYTTNKYKHRYYEVMDPVYASYLKIKKNRIEKKGEQSRALVNFKYVDRFPPLNK